MAWVTVAAVAAPPTSTVTDTGVATDVEGLSVDTRVTDAAVPVVDDASTSLAINPGPTAATIPSPALPPRRDPRRRRLLDVACELLHAPLSLL